MSLLATSSANAVVLIFGGLAAAVVVAPILYGIWGAVRPKPKGRRMTKQERLLGQLYLSQEVLPKVHPEVYDNEGEGTAE